MISEYFSKAREFEDQGRFALAAEEYKQAIELGIGDQAEAHQKRGRALTRIGRYEEALDECQKALVLDSDLPLAHSVLGYIYLQQARYDLAEEEYLKSLNLEPDNVHALGNLAYIYCNQDEYEKAIAMCKKGLQYQPRDFKLRISLAECYRCQYRFGEAMVQLNEARKVRFSFRIFIHVVAILVTAVLQSFKELDPVIGATINIAIYGVALFAPSFLSIPVGLVLLIFGLLLIFMYPLTHTYKGAKLKLIFLFLWYFMNVVLYWGIVFLVRPRLIAWWLSFD